MFVNQLRRIVPESWKRAATDHDFWLQAKLHLLTKPMYSGLGSILAFHRVCPAPERPQLGLNKDLEVTPELLENTIKFFKHIGDGRRRNVVDISGVLLQSFRSTNGNLPPRKVTTALADCARLLIRDRRERRFFRAVRKGERKAAQFLTNGE